MRRTILLYGVALAALTGILKFIEYRFFVRDLSLEFYLGLVAVLFTSLGIWAGLRLTRRKAIPSDADFKLDDLKLQRLGITNREYEVLALIAQGLSNREIADKLFVSLNTVKSHSSNLFLKLDARSRTQAVVRAKEHRILP
ncbi:MAG: response regulator transcription factor [Planctomycetota bacterium]|jgi:DNA-binding CsgD family transcriptional regulator